MNNVLLEMVKPLVGLPDDGYLIVVHGVRPTLIAGKLSELGVVVNPQKELVNRETSD